MRPESRHVTTERAKLTGWLATIKKEVQALRLDDEIFWVVQDIWNNDDRFERLSGVFQRFVFNNFATSGAVAVRRQVKGHDKDSVSLMRVLLAVKECPAVVSRQHYLGLFAASPELLGMANDYFDGIAGIGKALIPAAVIDLQIDELKTTCDRIEHYADRRVAHTDRRGTQKDLPTLADLTEAWTTLERIVLIYLKLLTASAPEDLKVSLGDWLDVFEIAWKPDPNVDSDGFRIESGGDGSAVDFKGR